MAQPGDIITVHAGTYREWVRPALGGTSDTTRIVYRSAPGEKVVIKGSEVIRGWKQVKKGVWKVVIDNKLFGDYNPYQEIIGGDWFKDKGRHHHPGEVYLNEKSLYELDSLEKVFDPKPLPDALDAGGSLYTWYTESNNETTTLWANFHDYNPNKELVEINVQPAVFFPEKTGVNYITVKGFRMCQAATQWAPPTAEQIGLIGPHWSKGWIIEDNVISDSKCTGISLGKDRSTGHNRWTNEKIKHGTQREREVIFSALEAGCSRENIGSHIVRNNVIYNCEQTAICGHLGAIFSEIYDNHIYNIHVKKQFEGAEIAGIKLHAPIDVLIKGNRIHNTLRGMWLDWQSQGTRVSRNVIYDSHNEDLFIEVNHGPMVVDHNILLSDLSLRITSQGTAFIHNFVAGGVRVRPIHNRYTPYHFPHSTAVAGLMTILNGDDRYYNNIFVGQPEHSNAKAIDLQEGETARQSGPDMTYGLAEYDEFPAPSEDWAKKIKRLYQYNEAKLPVFIESNLYLNGARPYLKERNAAVDSTRNDTFELDNGPDGLYLNLEVRETWEQVETQMINTGVLGRAFQSELPYENYNGRSLEMDEDYFGRERNTSGPMVGPFEHIKPGEVSLRIWEDKNGY